MIVTKTPLRVSFFGGGSDLPHFFNKQDGLCVSTSISEYMMVAVNRCATDHIKLMYSEIEIVDELENLKHTRARECLRLVGIDSNVEIASFANIPTKGTGLGSSSTFTVGLLHALRLLDKQRGTSARDLAEDACTVEILMCEEPIGKQDQYAAAFGGLNAYEFTSYGVNIRPIHMHVERRNNLEDSLLFFSTQMTRSASDILEKQVQENKHKETQSLVDLARRSVYVLEKGNLNDIGEMLDYSWNLKKMLSKGVSTPHIDTIYERGIKAGAIGGKLLGAGGGGYMMFFVPHKKKRRVIEAMAKMNCPQLLINMTDRGSTAYEVA